MTLLVTVDFTMDGRSPQMRQAVRQIVISGPEADYKRWISTGAVGPFDLDRSHVSA